MEAYQGRGFLCVYGERKKRGGGSVKKELVLMCGEVFMGKVCARIKHGRKLCVANAYNKASGFFVQISCSSQIHCWICFKFKLVLV
jgi:hypothetical protein